MRRNHDLPPGSEGRRSFLRKAGLGSVGVLALAGLGDVFTSPAASAGTHGTRSKANGRMTIIGKNGVNPRSCLGVATCYPCSGCCGAPCKPTGVAYCFYCTATPCQGAGVQCIDHPPSKFTICCT